MSWWTLCVAIGTAALVSCGESDGATEQEDELPLADSVVVMIQFYDAWTSKPIGVTTWIGLNNGAVLRRTDAMGVMVPGRGGTLEVRIPADEYQTSAFYGPASWTITVPDTVHANYGGGTGLYSTELVVAPLALGPVVHGMWRGDGAMPRLALSLRHADALGALAIDSFGYRGSHGWGCKLIGSSPVTVEVCDSFSVHADTAFAEPPWSTTWEFADTVGVATLDLPSSRWSADLNFDIYAWAILHDSTRQYRVQCAGRLAVLTDEVPTRWCQTTAWLTGN